MIAIELNTPETVPRDYPVSHIAHTETADKVSDRWVGGKQVLANKIPAMINTDSIFQRATQWQEKIAANSRLPLSNQSREAK